MPKERCQLLWEEVNELSDLWMTTSVNFIIANKRYAPLAEDWRELIYREKERNYDAKKSEHTRDAKEFMASYPAEDIQTICAQIRDRIQGRMSDSNFKGFKKMLTPPAEYFRCKRCEDKNVSTDELGAATICGCRPLT